MEFKGTKGEWYVDGIHSMQSSNLVLIHTKDTWGLCKVSSLIDGVDNKQRTIEANANAKLIAAAPELLEMLQEAVVGYEWRKENQLENWDKADEEHLEKCRIAIKKAIG